jgi:hypothetical protein
MRWVDRLDLGSCESKISRWSRRPVERASYESERGRGILLSKPRTSRNMVEAFRSLSRLVSLVLFSLIIDCGYPLFLVLDSRLGGFGLKRQSSRGLGASYQSRWTQKCRRSSELQPTRRWVMAPPPYSRKIDFSMGFLLRTWGQI